MEKQTALESVITEGEYCGAYQYQSQASNDVLEQMIRDIEPQFMNAVHCASTWLRSCVTPNRYKSKTNSPTSRSGKRPLIIKKQN